MERVKHGTTDTQKSEKFLQKQKKKQKENRQSTREKENCETSITAITYTDDAQTTATIDYALQTTYRIIYCTSNNNDNNDDNVYYNIDGR